MVCLKYFVELCFYSMYSKFWVKIKKEKNIFMFYYVSGFFSGVVLVCVICFFVIWIEEDWGILV